MNHRRVCLTDVRNRKWQTYNAHENVNIYTIDQNRSDYVVYSITFLFIKLESDHLFLLLSYCHLPCQFLWFIFWSMSLRPLFLGSFLGFHRFLSIIDIFRNKFWVIGRDALYLAYFLMGVTCYEIQSTFIFTISHICWRIHQNGRVMLWITGHFWLCNLWFLNDKNVSWNSNNEFFVGHNKECGIGKIDTHIVMLCREFVVIVVISHLLMSRYSSDWTEEWPNKCIIQVPIVRLCMPADFPSNSNRFQEAYFIMNNAFILNQYNAHANFSFFRPEHLKYVQYVFLYGFLMRHLNDTLNECLQWFIYIFFSSCLFVPLLRLQWSSAYNLSKLLCVLEHNKIKKSFKVLEYRNIPNNNIFLHSFSLFRLQFFPHLSWMLRRARWK